MKDVKKLDLNLGPQVQYSNTLTTRLQDCSCRVDGKSLVFMHCAYIYVASPDPDPNPRGGGQLPNPKSAILH